MRHRSNENGRRILCFFFSSRRRHTRLSGYWSSDVCSSDLANFFTLLFHFHQEAFEILFTFCHKGGVICIYEVIDISPDNLDSSLCFFQPSVSHDVLCIEVK